VAWDFGLVDLQDGSSIGRIERPYATSVNLPFKGPGASTIELHLDDPSLTDILDRDGRVLMKAYQKRPSGWALPFFGELTSCEETGTEDGEIVASAVFNDGLWRLAHRLAYGAGPTYSPDGVTFAGRPRNLLLTDLITRANDLRATGIIPGTMTTMEAVNATYSFKPISEVLAEMGLSPIVKYDPPVTYSVQDTLGTGTWTAGANPRRVPDTSTTIGNWGSAGGSSSDFFRNGTSPAPAALVRNFWDAGGLTGGGRWAWLATPINGDVVVQSDVRLDEPLGGLAQAYFGVMARMQAQNAFVYANVSVNPSGVSNVELWKKLPAGGWTLLQSFTGIELPVPSIGSVFSLRLRVLANGEYAVWYWRGGGAVSPGQPVILGDDTDMATGGQLANGQVGVYDAAIGSGGSIPGRWFYNFYAFVPVSAGGIEELDWRLTTVDSQVYAPGGSPPTIAQLDVSPQIGSVKPNCIFEFADGSHTTKSYRKLLDRNGLMNVGYALGSGDDSRVATGSDDASILREGMFEEVVASDIGDYGLRQAYIKKQIAVRGQARTLLNFEPASLVTPAPVFGVDFDNGDWVTARARVDGSERYNGLVRVYGVEINRDEDGTETMVPTLVESS
jgi:hypothetical protein